MAQQRLSASTYKLLICAHVLASVGWFGAALAKLTLALIAMSTSTTELYQAVSALNVVFPPLAIATLVTGVILSLKTRWGLVQHYWVLAKLGLTFGVVASSVRLTDIVVAQAWTAAAPWGVFALSSVHIFMLGVATVISVYKPWGRIHFSRLAGVAALQRLLSGAAAAPRG